MNMEDLIKQAEEGDAGAQFRLGLVRIMKTYIIGIGTYANRIIEIIQQHIVDCQIQFWQIDKDKEGYLNGDFINFCMESESSRPNKESINQRLGLLVAESGLSPIYYAKKIGYPTQRFRDVLDGVEEVDVSLLKVIRKAYPDIDLNWLVRE